jgi:hypothetical protein
MVMRHEQRRLEGGELGAILARKDHVLLGPHPVPERIPGGARLALGGFGPRNLAPFFRLASARALLLETAARGDCPVGLGSGAPTPL